MSQRIAQDVWALVPLAGYRKLALLALAFEASELGGCAGSMTKIAAGVMSRQQMHRGVTYLRQHRWIVTHRMHGQSGLLIYQLNLPKIQRSTRTDA